MKRFRLCATVLLVVCFSGLQGQDLDSGQKNGGVGDTTGARALLARAAESNPRNIPR